ncbi:beta family protein [Corallococcus exercitus]|uniref:beta family protein n=1 Tax=Corallococcus exercitus TaxID=2316736 RepID=UPI0013156D9C|nr:beta family protein [Corallococcus exercitus]
MPQSFNHTPYVPILKLMMGEREALAQLEVTQRTRVTPLFEIRPPKSKPVKDKRKTFRMETMEEVLGRIGPQLAKAIPDCRAFIDGLHLTPAQMMASGEHPLAYVLAQARKSGVALVPSTGPERPPEYQAVVRAAVAEDQRGICVRVRKKELFEDNLDERLSSVLHTVGASRESTDLVLDLGSVEPDDVSMLSKSIPGVLSTLHGVTAFRTLTLAAGAFPQSISHIKLPTKVPRADWLLWQTLASKAESLVRLPTYGDYAIQGASPPSPDAAMHPGSPNIRYTADDHWLVVRGGAFKHHGYDQYSALAEHLMEQECYAGRTFSWGDAYIFGCAGGAETPGSPGVWRKVGTNHHITKVLKQLTSPHAP